MTSNYLTKYFVRSIHSYIYTNKIITSQNCCSNIFHFTFQDLSETIISREPDILSELQTTADSLKSSSSPEIQNEIDIIVDESVVQWNDSRKSLRKLCERYQNAINIWSVYRKNSDIVNEWVDNQLNSLTNLPKEEALQQLQVGTFTSIRVSLSVA